MFEDIETAEDQTLTTHTKLVDEVHEQVGNPLSVWAVAATIESLGVRDIDARKDFGCDSVFDLAEDVFATIKERVRREDTDETLDVHRFNKAPLLTRIGLFVKYYSKGLLFSLPMVSQIAAIILFRYSLWAWLEFNEAQATLVSFGTIAAFIVTGGFTQTLGRSVTKYISEENYSLAYKSIKKITKGGVITTALVGLLFFLFNLVIPFYPQGMLLLALAYFILISLLLLASGVLYALRQQLMILLIIVTGTAVVIAGMDVFDWGIYFAHWTGLLLTIGLLSGYAVVFMRLKIGQEHQDLVDQSLPETGVRYYINYRYFIYGFMYFSFLFLDRVLAWSSGTPPPPYIVWFNTPYELGMDWALLSLILTIAVLEYSVNTFSRKLMPLQKGIMYDHLENFSSYFRSFYMRQLLLVSVVGIISIGLSFWVVDSLRFLRDDIPELRDFFTNPMTTRIFWIASISYLFMVIGLLHTLFFFTLNKPKFAMYSIIPAFAVNFFVGFICSRIFGLEFATIGLLFGSLTFAGVSGYIARDFFKNLDYYYYSAF